MQTLTGLGIEHVALNPGATLRGIHESLINGPLAPQPVLTLHENVAVGIAHGYAKAAGRPMAVALHDTVGLLNGSMALFNAWADRAPILVMVGTGPLDSERRRPWIDWVHTAGDQGELVRRFSVWNDQPQSIGSLVESMVRGLSVARGPVGGPAVVAVDLPLQELRLDGVQAIKRADIPRVRAGADPDAVRSAVELLRVSRRPLLVADRPLTVPAAAELVQLAEKIGAGMYEAGGGGTVPVGHPLDLTDSPEVAASADLLLCVDARDVAYIRSRVGVASSVPAIVLGVAPLRDQSWMPLESHGAHDVQIAAEPELGLAAIGQSLRMGTPRRWQPSAVPLEPAPAGPRLDSATLAVETAAVTEGEDVVIAHGALDGWVRRCFRLQRPDQFLGRSGGEGLGYSLPATLGAALAHRDSGRLVVGFQTDGDLMYTPQALWTAARARLPALMVVANNRCYERDARHQRMAAVARGRDQDRAAAGVALDEPQIAFADLARSLGVAALGPVDSIAHFRAALREGVEAVRAGSPYLIEVMTERERTGPEVGRKGARLGGGRG